MPYLTNLDIISYPLSMKRPVLLASASENPFAPLAINPVPQRINGTGSAV
jgi:hypothetical protein